MARTLTNNLSLAYAIEQTLGVLPGSPAWKKLEPNTLGSFGSETTTVSRSPISPDRQRRKGGITDLDSMVELEADFTLEHFLDFAEGFCFSTFKGAAALIPTATTVSGYTVPVSTILPANTLVVARGFTNAINNGLKTVGAGGTTTNVAVTGLTAETPPVTQNPTLEVAGVIGAVGDLTINAAGNLASTTLNFTTLNLVVGQWIYLPTGTNGFANVANNGFARIVAIATNILTLERKSQVFVTDTGAGKQIQVFFGRFVRNVATDHADYLERSFQFEAAYKNLQDPGPGDEYEYAKGNYCNEMTFNLPLADKATISFGFVGTDTAVPTTVRATNAANAKQPVQTSMLNTTSDIARLSVNKVDESGLTTDFKSVGLTLNNNVGGEKVVGTLGSKYMNTGNFEVDLESQVLFTKSAVLSAIRNNDRVNFHFALKNADGGAVTDIPSMTLGDGSRDFPVNESIALNLTAMAYKDPTLGYSISFSVFPYLP